MPGQCCTGEGPSRRLARRWARAAASTLPGAVLVLLPRCPLCLAAWLTAVAGVGISAAAAAHVRGLIVVFWVPAAALAAAQIIRRRTYVRSLERQRTFPGGKRLWHRKESQDLAHDAIALIRLEKKLSGRGAIQNDQFLRLRRFFVLRANARQP